MAVRAIAQSTESLLVTPNRIAGGLSVSKYGNRRTTVDGVTYDSAKEARRGAELRLMERAGLIRDLRRQVRFCLVPTIEGEGRKVRQRAAYYVADFEYWEKVGDKWRHVVEDVKGVRTDVYKLKKKIMLWRYGIEVREV